MISRILLLFLLSLFYTSCFSGTHNFERTAGAEKKIGFSSFSNHRIAKNKPNLLVGLIKKKLRHTKRLMAALLALPLPFGILALHRIYLGTKPYVPVVYIGTIGGVFGILPFIDFCVLLFDNDIERFTNNSKVFMWIN